MNFLILIKSRRNKILISLTLCLGIFSTQNAVAAENILVPITTTDQYFDFLVYSTGGSYQIDLKMSPLTPPHVYTDDPFLQLYSGTITGPYIDKSMPNPPKLIAQHDDFVYGSQFNSQIIGSATIGAPFVIRASNSWLYERTGNVFAATYYLSYTGLSETEPVLVPEPVLVLAPIPEPIPEPYLRATKAPEIHLKDNKLICTSGIYQAGYSLGGGFPTHGNDVFTPSEFIYSVTANGVTQNSQTLKTSAQIASWDLAELPTDVTMSCTVTVSANSLTTTSSSTENTTGLRAMQFQQSEAIATANSEYIAQQSKNSSAYKKALLDNRISWRTQIDELRAKYFAEKAQIGNLVANKESRAFTAAALKTLIKGQKQSATEHRASKPAALAAKNAANKAALEAHNSAIAKANANYGAYIESIGYGVLIP